MATPNITLKTDLLETVRPIITEILEITNKPYLSKGDVRKLTALSQTIRKARHELLELKAYTDTRLGNREQSPTKPAPREIDLRGKTRLSMDE